MSVSVVLLARLVAGILAIDACSPFPDQELCGLENVASSAEVSLMQLGMTVDLIKTQQRQAQGSRQGSAAAAADVAAAGEDAAAEAAAAAASRAAATAATAAAGVADAVADVHRVIDAEVMADAAISVGRAAERPPPGGRDERFPANRTVEVNDFAKLAALPVSTTSQTLKAETAGGSANYTGIATSMRLPPEAQVPEEAATNMSAVEEMTSIAAPSSQMREHVDSSLVFIGVMTGLANAKRRNDVRTSWVNHAILKNGTVKYKFVVGQPDPSDPAAVRAAHEVKAEDDVFNDFLHLPFIDTYDNLTMKTIEFIRWFSKSRSERFVMKLDDDTFPHFDLLAPYLRAESGQYTYYGLFSKCAPVMRVGKWAISYEQMPGEYLPVYTNGASYMLSGPLAKELTTNYPEPAERYVSEDVTVGAWVIEASASVPVEYRPLPSTWYGCHAGDFFSQNLMEERMQCMWKSSTCCDEPRFIVYSDAGYREQHRRTPTGVADFSLRGSEDIMGGDLDSDTCPSYAGPSTTTLKSLALSNIGAIAALIMWRQWRQWRQMHLAGPLSVEAEAQDRSALLDNAKWCAQFLVIYNHILYGNLALGTKDMETILSGGDKLMFTLNEGMSFVVNPFFCFISGVVSQGSPTSKRVVRYVQYLVIPTYIFHFVVAPLFIPLLASLDPHIFLQAIREYDLERLAKIANIMPAWYLFALCIWRGSVYLIWSHMRPATAFIGMVVVGCIGGYFQMPTQGFHGFNAAMAYFPCFAAGYICPFPALVRAIPKPGAFGSLMALLAAIGHVFVVMPFFFPAPDDLPDGHGWYGSEQTQQLNFQYAVPWEFWLWWSRRLAKVTADMVAPMLLLFFVIPRRETPITYTGAHTLYSYLFHGCAVGVWKNKLLAMGWAPVITSGWGHALVLVIYVPFALSVLLLFTSRYFRLLFGWALTPKWLDVTSSRLVHFLERHVSDYEDASETRCNDSGAAAGALTKR